LVTVVNRFSPLPRSGKIPDEADKITEFQQVESPEQHIPGPGPGRFPPRDNRWQAQRRSAAAQATGASAALSG
jgi:hypothetical protein